jgi:hypothetical protein
MSKYEVSSIPYDMDSSYIPSDEVVVLEYDMPPKPPEGWSSHYPGERALQMGEIPGRVLSVKALVELYDKAQDLCNAIIRRMPGPSDSEILRLVEAVDVTKDHQREYIAACKAEDEARAKDRAEWEKRNGGKWGT